MNSKIALKKLQSAADMNYDRAARKQILCIIPPNAVAII